MSQDGSKRPQVVIVGGGFGGLEAAKALARAPVDVTIVDRENHHCFQPLLYQVATAALSPADIAWPIRSILSRQRNARVVLAEVTGVDLAARKVITGSTAPIPYDFLVLATGATHSYFGHDEWASLAPGLKRIEDATDIRRHLLLAFERAEIELDPAERQRLLTFVIIGGGPTGVELAGAVADIARYALARDFRRIDPRASRIVLVEAEPRLLSALPADMGQYAQDSLDRMGVDVRISTTVTSCDEHGVRTASGERIEAATMIWAAGVKASPAAAWTGAEADKAGRIKVKPDLSVPGHPEVLAIGDTALVASDNGRPVPGIAPAAKQMGRYAGQAIAARSAGKPVSRRFDYRHYGDLATIGRKSAVVGIGRVRLKGFIGWAFWSIAHIYFLIGTRNRLSVAFDWFWYYLTFQRGARLISRGSTPSAFHPSISHRERAPRDVVEDHLRLRREGRLEEDLKRNFSEDVVLLTSWGTFQGHEGVRKSAAKLKNDAPEAVFQYEEVLTDGLFGFLRWSANGKADEVTDGADSFVLQDGKIIAQSIHYHCRRRESVQGAESR